MNNTNLIRGLFLVAIALVFGIASTQHTVGHFNHPGPGLFPLLVSCMLGVIGVLTVIQAQFAPKVAMTYNVKNIVIIIASLCGFAAVSLVVNMLLGIAFLVFFSGIAAKQYSVWRNTKITLCLIAVAFAFKSFLGLNLPLY